MGCKGNKVPNNTNRELSQSPIWLRLILFLIGVAVSPIFMVTLIWILYDYIVLNNEKAADKVASMVINKGKKIFEKQRNE